MESAARQMLRLRKHQAASLQELKDRVAAARAEMAARLRRANDSGRIISAEWRAKFLDGTQGIYDRLGKDLDAWGKRITGDVAKSWHDEALDDITTGKPGAVTVVNDVLAFDKARVKTYWELIHPDNGQNLAGVMTKKMREQDLAILRQSAITVFRQGQLEAVPQRELAKRIQQEWDKAAGNMESARFVDAAGRPWDNGRYLQMLVRTTTARVARESYFDTLTQHGDDLVMIKATGDTCPKCQAWSGVIVSITGTTKDFPSYQDARASGVFHPNCDCLTQRMDETVHAQDIQRQRGTPNVADWTDLKQVRDYKASFSTNQAGGSTAGSAGAAGSGATKKKVTITTKVAAPTPAVPAAPAPVPAAAPVTPGGSLEWKPVKSVKEAQAQIQKHLDENLAARRAGKLPDYMKAGDGTYLSRFKGYRGATKADAYDVVNFPKKMDVDTANALGEHFMEMQRAADALGIPRLRGLQVTKLRSGVAAQMGDGVLGVQASTVQDRVAHWTRVKAAGGDEALVAFNDRTARIQGHIAQMKADLVTAGQRLAEAKANASSAYVAQLEKWAADIRAEIASQDARLAKHLADGVPAWQKAAASTDPWKAGLPGKNRPFLMDRYPNPKAMPNFKATNWHEFGHHIHQQTGVTTVEDYMGVPGRKTYMTHAVKAAKKQNGTAYEVAVNKAYAAAAGSPKEWLGTHSVYGTHDSFEWFAENFTAAMMGRDDLVDSAIRPFLKPFTDKLAAAGVK